MKKVPYHVSQIGEYEKKLKKIQGLLERPGNVDFWL